MQFEAIGTPKPDFAYYGEHGDWLVTLAQTRDSDAAERSNWRYITSGILLAYPDDAVIESMGHWAVGWVEYLLVRPGSPAVEIMERWADILAVYPIADEEDYERMLAEEEAALATDDDDRLYDDLAEAIERGQATPEQRRQYEQMREERA